MFYDVRRNIMKHVFYLLFSALSILLPLTAGAVQLDDISPTLTRSMADGNLSKDYQFRVLSDMSVRRVWNLDSNRKLSLDFNPSSDKLLMAMVEYRKAVSPKEASRDARKLTGAKKAKWKKMDSKRVAKYDVAKNSRNSKLGDCYGFIEMNSSGKCTRLMVYTTLPTENRSRLGTADPNDDGVTALGSRSGGGLAKTLYAQEERRLRTPVASASSVAVSRPAATRPADDDADTLSDEVDTTDDDTGEVVEVRSVLDDLLEQIGLGGVSPMYLIGGVVGLILLLVFISAIRRLIARRRMARFLAEAEAAELEEVRAQRKN